MKANSNLVIGVDFGTANSYFATSSSNVSDVITWNSAGSTILETAVCYGKDKKVFSIGQKALADYIFRPKEEGLSIKYWFKPEIAEDEEAKQAAIDFIKAAISYQEGENRALFPDSADVILGCPSNSPESFKKTLSHCFLQAGMKQTPEIVSEPVGALIALLNQQQIDLSLISEGILVVDMGAGTCDLTVFRGLTSDQSWGDSCYGGRLFDDLFYQLFLKYHPDAELLKKLPSQNAFYLQSVACRKEKEDFSDDINTQLARGVPSDSVRYITQPINTHNLGTSQCFPITYKDFVEAAENYKPSDLMCSMFPGDSIFSKELLKIKQSEKGKNLIEWFRELLTEDDHLKGIKKVILAGGSCRLPFVKEVIEEVLKDKKVMISVPPRPFELIATGLAALPEHRLKCEDFVTKLQNSKSFFVSETKRKIRAEWREWADYTAAELIKHWSIHILEPVLRHVHENNIDSLKKLKDILERAYDERDDAYRTDEEEIKADGFTQKLGERIIEYTNAWIAEHATGFYANVSAELCGQINIDLPRSIADIIGKGLGAALLVALFLSLLGLPLPVALPIILALSNIDRIPLVARIRFKSFVKKIENDESRAQEMVKIEKIATKELSKSLLEDIGKKLETILSEDVADQIIQRAQQITQAFERENL